jgi:SPP1 gp7 family putative phage head morphogenesis protein
MGILSGIYKRRFDRADNANRRHPLLRPIPDARLNDVASKIYFYIKHIIEYAKAEVRLPIKLSIELDNKIAPAGKEGAKKALANELKEYLIDANGRGIDAARIQEKFATYKVDWNKKNIEAVMFLDDYTIKLSDYLSAQAEFELRSTIQDGLLQGEGAAGINRMINDQVLDTYKGRSMAIARTEGMRALNGGRMGAFRDMGFDEVFWIASDLACDECKDLDNHIYAIDELPPQPFHVNCRCTTGAITEFTPRKGNKVDYDFETLPEGFEW